MSLSWDKGCLKCDWDWCDWGLLLAAMPRGNIGIEWPIEWRVVVATQSRSNRIPGSRRPQIEFERKKIFHWFVDNERRVAKLWHCRMNKKSNEWAKMLTVFVFVCLQSKTSITFDERPAWNGAVLKGNSTWFISVDSNGFDSFDLQLLKHRASPWTNHLILNCF